MTDEAQANAWKSLVSGVKAHGALAIAQMMHAGAPRSDVNGRNVQM